MYLKPYNCSSTLNCHPFNRRGIVHSIAKHGKIEFVLKNLQTYRKIARLEAKVQPNVDVINK